ncbi:hypothetical protein JG688_00013050 [Phytophthora aleatoria]|uniref:Uncharacterized protein n=1 Tax=Phytophthora aleatoria TaxID=2496075 RepID=A0A8J5IXT4_9STRA|nr:hypothetical protein JG688_00013050 [Phytophthora aleatoria]
MFTSSKTKELQGLLKVEDNLGNYFKKLGLSTMPIGKNDYIEDPDGAMFTALTNVFGEKNVATMILLGKHSWGSSTAAKKLEKAQFNKWYAKDNHLSNSREGAEREINRHPYEFSGEIYLGSLHEVYPGQSDDVLNGRVGANETAIRYMYFYSLVLIFLRTSTSRIVYFKLCLHPFVSHSDYLRHCLNGFSNSSTLRFFTFPTRYSLPLPQGEFCVSPKPLALGGEVLRLVSFLRWGDQSMYYCKIDHKIFFQAA